MQNVFLSYEDDFRLWVESGFAPSKPETQDYLRFLADPADERQPRPGGLWRHQWEALLRVVYSREVAGRKLYGDGVLTNIVTGGGKTALIAATMVWLRLSEDVQRYLILCPNLIVRDRLEDDFRDGKVFVDRGLIPPDAVLSASDFALTTLGGSSRSTAAQLFGANVVLANIHQFYESNTSGKANLHAFLQMNQTPFAVFNDEAHNTPAPEYDKTLRTLSEHGAMKFRLDTTATPDRADEQALDSQMIYEYDIPAALNDGIIATPVVYQPSIDVVDLKYRDAQTGETKRVEEINWDEVDRQGLSSTQWVTDAKPMSQQISIATKRLEEAKRNAAGRYRPILFVVAVCKADAQAAKSMLESEFKLRALIVTEDEDESARHEAATIARKNRYDAVVAVAMLREGWDVPEVSVILPLRKMGSKVYAPQIIGRGLRRVRRPDIPPEEGQICAVVDHPKLEHDWLWEQLQARIRENVGTDQDFEEKDELPKPPPRQEIVNSDMLVAIPDPTEDEGEYEPVKVEPSPEPSPEWSKLLQSISFSSEAVEIVNQHIKGIEAHELRPGGWATHVAAPSDVPTNLPNLSQADLAVSLKQALRDLTERAVAQHGYSSQEQRLVLEPLRQYVSDRFLNGERFKSANREDLIRARSSLSALEQQLMQRTDIVGGMIEYAND